MRLVVDAVGVTGEADERLLDEVLGGVAVVDEEAHEADEPMRLLLEQRHDEAVDVDVDVDAFVDGDAAADGAVRRRPPLGRRQPHRRHHPD